MFSSRSFNISRELVENVAHGNCVLFLGSDAAYQTDDWTGPPTRAQLAAALAQKYEWVAPDQALGAAAEEFLSREPADYHSLIALVQDHVWSCPSPGPPHRILADLPCGAIVSNCYDDLLEIALREQGRPVLQVVGDTEIAYAGGKADVIVIRLAGTVNQPESLVLTNEDHIQVENHLSEKIQAVRSWLTLYPLLFLGWDPEDAGLRRLYHAATEKLGKHRRHNFIVWPEPSQRALAIWRPYNVEIVPVDTLTFLRRLQGEVQQLRADERKADNRSSPVVNKIPYKFLNYFDPDDQDIFCGREVEAQLVYRLALAHRALILFGQSGVGKTSLLRAGVVPLFVKEGYRYVYVRTLGDPAQAVRDEVARALNVPDGAGSNPTLLALFQHALGDEGKLVVILDQLEELFARPLSSQTRARFWRELGACLGLASPEVHFILALREDYLAQLDEARRSSSDDEPAAIPSILHNSYRLIGLEAGTAYLAIVEPARRANCEIEPLLADVLVGRAEMPGIAAEQKNGDERGRRTWSLVEADGKVPPPSLQIVMDRLYRSALAELGKAAPPQGQTAQRWRPPPLRLTLDQYRALGGAGRLLAEYVSEALDRVPAHGGEQALAAALLKIMVTSQATKAALDEADLVHSVAETVRGFDPAGDLAALRATRDALVGLRLVRSFTVGARTLYELAHDHIAAEIATWIDAEEMQAKLARELLRRELDSWRQHGLLIGPEALRLIHEQRGRLQRLSIEELELLFRSALAANYEMIYWSRRAYEGGVARDSIVLEGLESPGFRVRSAAASMLGQLADEAFIPLLVKLLSDLYPQVRMAAILALESYGTPEAWQALMENLSYEVYVRAGEFIMGSDEGPADERPAHRIYLDAFYIGKYPVTNAEYKRYMDDIGRVFDMPEGKADHPVIGISWYDACEYAAWAQMRLLTEAEWEKAASWDATAQQKRQYPWGDDFDANKCTTGESGINHTTPVGSYSPQGDSPYGCAEMAGNVWEWTSSIYTEYPYRADDGREDRSLFQARAVRGGTFSIYQDAARTTYRGINDPIGRNWYDGFRVGLTSSRAKETY